jgi:hypothetical protein
MKNKMKIIALTTAIVIVALLISKPVFGAKGSTPAVAAIEYKVVLGLGTRSTITKMDKALDSFEQTQKEAQKGKAILEIDLKKFGDEGWELVYFERESGYAIFKRPVAEAKK